MSELLTAWRTNERWRLDFLECATRALSKTGGLEAHAHVMAELAPDLTRDEVLSLYARLQQSDRPSSEWQAEFLSIFKQVSKTDLPPPIVDEDEAELDAEAAKRASLWK